MNTTHPRATGPTPRRRSFARGLRTVLLAAVATTAGALALAQTGDPQEIEMGSISGPLEAPRRHFRLRNPAEIGPDEAARVYRIAKPSLRAGYEAGAAPHAASGYQGWAQYNSAPYLSATHGNHYINNYANDIARDYGRFEQAGRLPPGSILAKDSFAVTETRGILLGPLFIMEKMPAGFNYLTGDWRYSQVRPDGTVLGETNGPGAARVEYCIACHLAVEHQDHLYYVPRAYRR